MWKKTLETHKDAEVHLGMVTAFLGMDLRNDLHGLTFFVARALKDLGLDDQRLSTPSFKKLLQLAELEEHHSHELFVTIQAGNAYSNDVREHFVELCNLLDAEIDQLTE